MTPGNRKIQKIPACVSYFTLVVFNVRDLSTVLVRDVRQEPKRMTTFGQALDQEPLRRNLLTAAAD
jgi:hypothetical protein